MLLFLCMPIMCNYHQLPIKQTLGLQKIRNTDLILEIVWVP